MKEKELKLVIPDWECGENNKRELIYNYNNRK